MSRPHPHLVIDARPRGPRGLLAVERIEGRPLLAHLVELASKSGNVGPITVHANTEEFEPIRSLLEHSEEASIVLDSSPPQPGSAVLRTDRLYDAPRLRRALLSGRDPETAVLWRLDRVELLEVAAEELVRRRSYQPLGRYWALAPARALARLLCPTRIRPNALTLVSGALMLSAAGIVAFAPVSLPWRFGAAISMAIALVLDTADGHLARLQGSSSEFGRWLDGWLDEVGDMALHAAIAWSAFVRDGLPVWLVLGMLYATGKFLFVAATAGEVTEPPPSLDVQTPTARSRYRPYASWLRSGVRLAGHADIRWHLWIVLAACGRLDFALGMYAAYFPARAAAVAVRKAVRYG